MKINQCEFCTFHFYQVYKEHLSSKVIWSSTGYIWCQLPLLDKY
jgi:hypothetical protein